MQTEYKEREVKNNNQSLSAIFTLLFGQPTPFPDKPDWKIVEDKATKKQLLISQPLLIVKKTNVNNLHPPQFISDFAKIETERKQLIKLFNKKHLPLGDQDEQTALVQELFAVNFVAKSGENEEAYTLAIDIDAVINWAAKLPVNIQASSEIFDAINTLRLMQLAYKDKLLTAQDTQINNLRLMLLDLQVKLDLANTLSKDDTLPLPKNIKKG